MRKSRWCIQRERPARRAHDRGHYASGIASGDVSGNSLISRTSTLSPGRYRSNLNSCMQANFGKVGAYYYWISRGVDNREVRANRIRKSVGAENTFSTDLTEFEPMMSELQPLIDKVWRHCEEN